MRRLSQRLRSFTKAIPNLLTLTRIALCPVSLFYLFNGKPVPALALFALASVTDFLDGFLARSLHATTAMGAILDPFADKLLLLGFFSAFMVWGILPAWFLGLVISVHLLQCLGYFILSFPTPTSRLEFHSSPLGKWNTTVQLTWIGILLLDQVERTQLGHASFIPEWFSLAVYCGMATLQISVFFHYFFHFRFHLSADFRALFPAHR